MNRFIANNDTVIDTQTGLMWTKDAALLDFPLSWDEALKTIKTLNSETLYGYDDWKLPNRKELFSLISHKSINPSLPDGHPFKNVFSGYYWTSSTCIRLPNQAWYIHLGGARVFKGMKYGSYMVWPVRTVKDPKSCQIFQTGQQACFNENGDIINCQDTGQDGEFQSGMRHKKNRFVQKEEIVCDQSTGLSWPRSANIYKNMMDWHSAHEVVSDMNTNCKFGHDDWRVPHIIELESLTDIGQHSPALPVGHLFNDVQDYYWSSTTSMYDKSYAWILYMIDGIVGVGYKPLSEFYLWPVRGTSYP